MTQSAFDISRVYIFFMSMDKLPSRDSKVVRCRIEYHPFLYPYLKYGVVVLAQLTVL